MYTLVLLRHGESLWNRQDLFTGWYDVDLTDRGEGEARAAGQLMATAGIRPDVVHTSLQKRAIRTVQLALSEMNLDWIPVKRSWRLNERHYGDLQGRNKTETKEKYGEEQFMVWRRSYDTPPPALADDDERHPRFDVRYADLPPDVLPATECLQDVVRRFVPYWVDGIVPDLRLGRTVLVGAHGNSLRALVKHLDAIGDDAIPGLNIPTGTPLVYSLDDTLTPQGDRIGWAGGIRGRYLGDEDDVRARIASVASQGRAAG
ncbi:MAG TPA: 2,3-diphosphoglycerate-dependent phosphoglycerate mutase [Acidimicrobiales bacterium]|nr:2,3-diphosphoglycerate-dependent phosphoglycerate mutase [Acidimicrobiales bacterium]